MLHPRKVLLEKYRSNTLSNEGSLRVHTIIRERFYNRRGYVVRDEIWEGGNIGRDDGNGWIRKKLAYNLNGDYIGDSVEAYRLYDKYGITHTEKRKKDSNHCSIGFSTKEKKWYGWSHRAIFGFSIGHKIVMGKAGFKPSNKEEFAEGCMKFWADGLSYASDDKHYVFGEKNGEKGVFVRYTYNNEVPNERLRGTIYENFSPFPKEWGKGAWTAKTIEDAKQMAKDFARSVS